MRTGADTIQSLRLGWRTSVFSVICCMAVLNTPIADAESLLEKGQTVEELRAYLMPRISEFSLPDDPETWLNDAESLRHTLLKEVVLRGVPESWLEGPVNYVRGETLSRPGYKIHKFRYEIVPGLWAGGLYYEPDNIQGKVPAVLNVNGHVGEPGMTVDYKQARCINLVKRGAIALNLEWIGMGQLSASEYSHNESAHLDLCGRSGLSVFYLALKKGLDILMLHPAADAERVAVTGLSGGGWQTIFISSLDTRVKLAVPNAGYIGLQERILRTGDIGDLEQCPQDFHALLDYVHLTAMLAPRPALLIYNVKDDCCFVAERARMSVFEPVQPLYALFGHPERFEFHTNHDPGTHNYLEDNRQAMYRFLNVNFFPEDKRVDEEMDVAGEILDATALAIEYPDDNANFYTLAQEAMKDLPSWPAPSSETSRLEKWRKETRQMLDMVVRPDPVGTIKRETVSVPKDINRLGAGAVKGWRLKTNNTWTVPCVEYLPKTRKLGGVTLVIHDGDRNSVDSLVQEALGRSEHVYVLDILFTGDCQPSEGRTWQWPMMIATVGRRPLGVQASQINAVLALLKDSHPDCPLRLAAHGRMSGLASLTACALLPGRADRLELYGMDASLKELTANQIRFNDYAAMFCFGLLEIADVPELVELCHPSKVQRFGGL